MIFRSPWPDEPIPDLPYSDYVFENVAARSDRPAFIDGPTGRVLTHGQVHDSARRLAGALARRGLRKGDRFAIVAPNLPEYAIAFHGIAMAGGVVTTANPQAGVDDLAWQLGDCGARFAITVPACLERLRAAADAATTLREPILVFGDEAPAGTVALAALLADDDTAPPDVAIDPRNDLLALPYSSGTTGRFKGVMLTHRNMVAMHAILDPVVPSDIAHQRTLAVLPFFHAYGLATMNGTLVRGMSSVTMPRFDLEQVLALIERWRVTSLAVVPPIVLALAKHPSVADHDLSSLRSVGCGGAPLDAGLQRAASERLELTVRQGYGLTETTVGVTGWPLDVADPKPGSVGRLLPNIEARIVDPATCDDLGTDLRGELWLRGPNVMRGYWNAPDATSQTLDADGWLRTGDVALIDADGNVFIVDRLKELIKVKGWQVAPAHLEGVLLEHSAVADAAVIGVPDDEAGERPMAFVVLRAPVSAGQLIADTARRLAPYQRLHAIEFVEAIPKSASGKILRRVLRERVARR